VGRRRERRSSRGGRGRGRRGGGGESQATQSICVTPPSCGIRRPKVHLEVHPIPKSLRRVNYRKIKGMKREEKRRYDERGEERSKS
jgi:hypothetical protein